MRLVIALLLGAVVLGAQTTPVFVGKGCTTVFVIDEDCDGYGVGPGMLPDADDTDPAVNTPATALAKYTTVKAWIEHFGYSATHIAYLAAPDSTIPGNDATAALGDPAHPYSTAAAAERAVGPGDSVVFRGGTYDCSATPSPCQEPNYGMALKGGTVAARITYIAYPGEKVVITGHGTVTFGADGQANYNAHGIEVTTTYPNGQPIWASDGGHYKISYCYFHEGFWGTNSNNIYDAEFSHNVWDTHGEHDIYLGGHPSFAAKHPQSGVVVRDNVVRGGSYGNSIHLNGPFDAPVITGNIIARSGAAAIDLMSGVQNAVITNNWIFNPGGAAIALFMYQAAILIGDPIGNRDQMGHTIANNVIWGGSGSSGGTSAMGIQINQEYWDGAPTYDQGHHLIENNIFELYSGPVFSDTMSGANLATSTIRNNVVHVRNPASTAAPTLGQSYVELHTYTPSPDYTDYNWDQFLALEPPGVSSNVNADPQFVHAVNSEWNNYGPGCGGEFTSPVPITCLQPEKFDLRLQSTSPGIGSGIAGGVASDLKGNTLKSPPSAGAYAWYPDAFSIMLLNDIHYETTYGAQNVTSFGYVRDWIAAHKNEWNLVAVMGNGDLQGGTYADPPTDWTGTAAIWQSIYDSGVKTVLGWGNHDVDPGSGQAGADNWNTYLAPLNNYIPNRHNAAYKSAWAPLNILNSSMYLPLDVSTSWGNVRLGLVEMGFEAPAGDTAWVRGQLDAATDRQFIIGTHTFLGADGNPCTAADGICGPAPGDNGNQDGVGIWNALKGNSRIIAIASGHYHLLVENTLTGTSGNAVQAVQGYNTGKDTKGKMLLLKFRPADHKMDIYAWQASNNTAEPSFGTAGRMTFDWTPIGGGAPAPITGAAPTITSPAPLTAGTVGVAYSYQFTATGDAPITWAAPSLPAGLTLDSTGLLHGTPTTAATSTISITATNPTDHDGPKSFTLTINPARVVPAGGFIGKRKGTRR